MLNRDRFPLPTLDGTLLRALNLQSVIVLSPLQVYKMRTAFSELQRWLFHREADIPTNGSSLPMDVGTLPVLTLTWRHFCHLGIKIGNSPWVKSHLEMLNLKQCRRFPSHSSSVETDHPNNVNTWQGIQNTTPLNCRKFMFCFRVST